MRIGNDRLWRPAVNFASLAGARPNDYFGPRVIPDFQLFYIVSGMAEIRIGGEHFTIAPGECVYYGPERIHRITVLEDSVYYSVHFEWCRESPEPIHPAYGLRNCGAEGLTGVYERDELELSDYGIVRMPPHFALQGLEPLFQQLVREYRDARPLHAVTMRALMLEILTAIVRGQLPLFEAESPSKITPALQAIRREPERNWTVDALAGLCGYHPNHFAKMFKREMGKTPKTFLVEERIKAAKQLLLSGFRLEHIAERLGYNSVHYFSKNFKEATGLSPKQFRQQAGSREVEM